MTSEWLVPELLIGVIVVLLAVLLWMFTHPSLYSEGACGGKRLRRECYRKTRLQMDGDKVIYTHRDPRQPEFVADLSSARWIMGTAELADDQSRQECYRLEGAAPGRPGQPYLPPDDAPFVALFFVEELHHSPGGEVVVEYLRKRLAEGTLRAGAGISDFDDDFGLLAMDIAAVGCTRAE